MTAPDADQTPPAPAVVAPAAAAKTSPSAGTPMSRFVTLGLAVLTALVILRAGLILFGANAEQPLVNLLYSFTEPIVAPFEGIFPQPTDDAGVVPLDLGAFVAAGALQFASAFIRATARRAAELRP